ncbi:MAG: acetyl-CoA carboxylase biotin carboxylase subunit [Lachnospiraceae bacterium]|nr:acetyl-CoA carboxylase biotin carboxylase subunit [Lachnospiraceae bacterium]
MIQKILVANRGEIAVRIIRACREMGIETVAVYSTADRDALHTQLADEAVCIGEKRSSESYLNMESIMSAAVSSGADAIHPGVGFLSENAAFVQLCEQCGIKFIGPGSEVIRLMGNKALARKTMIAAGVPVIPGCEREILDCEDAIKIAKKIGYPIMIKAAFGGGGKGMRVAYEEAEFANAFLTAKKESEMAFGDGRMYLERYIQHPRHIEFQIMADSHGNIIHLGERDCSVQRNHQKMIEESPSDSLDEPTREKMAQTAVRAARAVGYENAGTVEFLLENSGAFYFMEMNTRIQVEHPVTEMVTGLDMIKEQIGIADGKRLSVSQQEVFCRGHAIECRINAEDPEKNFSPCPGHIAGIYMPGGNGVRVDSAVFSGYDVSPFYDSMLAKLIVHGKNRSEAIRKMRRALGEVVIEGITSNVDYLYDILCDKAYEKGDFDVSFVEEFHGRIYHDPKP